MFQILALDGGGIRGIFSAAVLAAVEQDLGVRVVDHFDLIAGTSTGGIIALALGLGHSPQDIVDFYVSEGSNIFANPFHLRSVKRLVRAKFDGRALVDALQRIFGDRKLGDSSKRLIIPSYNLGEDDVYLFRTAHHARLRRDYRVPAWMVAQATTAAPTYFPAARCVDQLRLVDGGVFANNPSLIAYIEAVATLGTEPDEIRVLNLGTCDSLEHRGGSLDRGGLFQWGTAGVEVVLRGQSISAAKHLRLLIGDDDLLRIDSPVPAGIFHLDGYKRTSDLVAKAAHHSRVHMPRIEKAFLNHQAPTFTPLYS